MFEHFQKLHQNERSFYEDQYLFHRSDGVKSVFAVLTGTVHLVRHHRDGRSVILQRAGAGSIVAEASLFTAVYHCDAIAASPVVVREISRAAMQQLFCTDQEFAMAWVAHLAGEVRNARLRAEILTLRTVSERLDAWLADKGQLPARGKWKAIAQEIGTSPEALYRELSLRRK